MIRFKVTYDAKMQQWIHHMKREGGGSLRVFGDPSSQRIWHMNTLGEYGVSLIKQRVAKGIGSDDAPMKPLKESYSKFKQRAKGRNIRDLNFTGDMLASLSVRSVSETQVRFDITSASGRKKASMNEQRSPWWGWSPSDLQKLGKMFQQLFGYQVINWGAKLFGTRAPIWMNPTPQYTQTRRAV